MKHVTALGEALKEKGVLAINVAFQIAVSKFMNAGGTWGVAYAILCSAYGRGEGRSISADDGPDRGADAGRDAGHVGAADQAATTLPAARPHTHAKRGAESIAAVQPALGRSLFDAIKLPDGRRLRDVRWEECPGLAQRYQRLTRILLACRNFAIPADPATTLDYVVPEAKLKDFVEAAEQLNHVE